MHAHRRRTHAHPRHASALPSSAIAWSNTHTIGGQRARARASPSMCLARAGEDLQGLLPSKWCPQTPYPRPSAAPAGRKRPAQTGSRSRPKPRQAWLKPPAAQIENAGFSGSLGCQSSRQRGSCVPCTLTCGMTTGERVSKGGERARVAVQTGAGKSGRVRGGVGPVPKHSQARKSPGFAAKVVSTDTVSAVIYSPCWSQKACVDRFSKLVQVTASVVETAGRPDRKRGFSSSLRCQKSRRRRGSCVSCEPTCGMTAGDTVSGRAVRSHVTA